MKNWFRKNKKWLTIVAVVLVTAILVGVLAASTNLIAKATNSNIFGNRERNDHNLIKIDSYESLDGEQFSGVKFDVDKDGVITIEGEADADIFKKIATVTYSDGTGSVYDRYFYISGVVDGSLETFYFTDGENNWFQVDSNTTVVKYKVVDGSTVSIDIYLKIKQGTDLDNVKIYPAVFTDPDATFYE